MHKLFAGRLFNFRPALSCAVALAFGVLFAVKSRFYGFRVALFPLFACLLFAVSCACFTIGEENADSCGKRWRTRLFRLLAVCVSFGVGYGDFCAYAAWYTATQNTEQAQGNIYVTARVEEACDSEKGVWIVLDGLSFDGKAAAGKLALYLYSAEEAKNANEGSIVAFDAKISANTAWADENGERVYEWRRNIRYKAKNCKNFRVLGNGAGVFAKLRARLKNTLKQSASSEAYALSLAILTGETAEMDGELSQSFRYGGVAHIFAVSGLHVGALFAFVTAFFSRRRLAGMHGAAKWSITAGALLFYGAICGFSASVVRAVVMCLAFYADKLSGLKRDSLNSAGKAAVLVLLVSPVSLFDAGFLLSFSAVAGILCLTPAFSRLLSAWLPERGKAKKFKKPLGAFFELLAVSLGATAATLPVLCCCFGYVSGVSLILNVLVVPIVSAAFPVFLAAAAIAATLPPLAGVILYVPSLLLSGLSLLFYAADFSAFAIETGLSAVSLSGYCGACVCACDRVNLRGGVRVAGVCAGVLVFLAGFFL